jgi:hypothetical protein
MDHSKLNKSIEIKLQKPKGFFSSGLFSSSAKSVFKVPPLNAVIESGFGKGPNKEFKGFQSAGSVDNVADIPFLNWTSLRSDKFDDPNKHRSQQLDVFKLLNPMNQDCCGACWAVSSSSAFADRYGIANDTAPIDPSVISVMSCCTKQMHKNVFAIVETPDCDINSSYSELGSSSNSMGMCSGGIPFSAGLSMFRNGLPDDKDTKYTSELFKCGTSPSFPSMNQALIDTHPCSEKIFTTDKIRMEIEPVYISSSQGPPSHYPELMKKALLEGGPLVGGYMVLGDFLGLGTDGAGLGSDSDKTKVMDWNSTGKVYVPGAYDKLFPSVSINSVGGSTTIEVEKIEGEQSVVNDTGVKSKSSIGSIFCGFHAIVVVGWGEMDMDYVDNKDVKTTIGKDGKPKLPFWICRNSWGSSWPTGDYYKGGVKVMADKTLEIPGGYWLHAMYPNESMALDVPIGYEGTDYGSTMVMTPEKKKEIQSPNITSSPNNISPNSSGEIINTWKDSEGYNCAQYSEFGWCTVGGDYGEGWNSGWGEFGDFKNSGLDALGACKECGSSKEPEELSNDTESKKRLIIGFGIGLPILLLIIFIIYVAYKDYKNQS